MLQAKMNSVHIKGVSHNENYMCLGSKHKGEYICKQNILFIEADENYSWLYTLDDKKFLGCKSLGFYEELLVSDSFNRIHRSYLINLSHLKKYEAKYRLVYLKREIVLPVSFRKSRSFSKYLESA